MTLTVGRDSSVCYGRRAVFMATVPKTPETETRPAVSIRSGQTSRYDELANLSFAENRPTEETAPTLRDELLFQRATHTNLWALPLISRCGPSGLAPSRATIPHWRLSRHWTRKSSVGIVFRRLPVTWGSVNGDRLLHYQRDRHTVHQFY